MNRSMDEGAIRENKRVTRKGSSEYVYRPVGDRDYAPNRNNHTAKTVLSGRHFLASKYYTDELKELVRRCLNFHQDARPTPRELFDEADELLNIDPNFADELKNIDSLGLTLPNESEFEIGKQLRDKYRKRRR